MPVLLVMLMEFLKKLQSVGKIAVFLSQLEIVPEQLRKILTEHVSSISSESELIGLVRHCSVEPCHEDPKCAKILFSVAPE